MILIRSESEVFLLSKPIRRQFLYSGKILFFLVRKKTDKLKMLSFKLILMERNTQAFHEERPRLSYIW